MVTTDTVNAPPAHQALSLRNDIASSVIPPTSEDLLRAAAVGTHDVAVELRPPADGHTDLRFVMYAGDERVSLSAVLPILHSLGAVVLDERTYPLRREDGTPVWIYDFALENRYVPDGGEPADGTAALRERFCGGFLAAWWGDADVDDFNKLILAAGLTWQQANLLRAYGKYLRQARFAHSPTRIAAVLAEHSPICTTLIDLFAVHFHPDHHRDDAAAADLAAKLDAQIDAVCGLDADRILRAYADLVAATTRTNFYRTRSRQRPRSEALSLKFDACSIPQLPLPRPRYEVFVYSPRVEGVHLRYGDVARGGLRWSDRIDDFRTEILGLVKAQAAKNAVIVPVGAKGGFVIKRPPSGSGNPVTDRDAVTAEAVACYRTFIAALLDVTDSIENETGRIIAPDQVVRRDGDDSYLVVAADKGTAAFSDHANAVAQRYGFWLGDAFASGGSVGYDHKAMGITARGAWESVRRHFREMDHDVDIEKFTVVGIGDMSGDVFGNGMLLSRQIELVAAFDHRHIFLDPNPDAERSFCERQRLFRMNRSSWADYDPALISAGGGVYARTAKSVPISAQVRNLLGLGADVDRLPAHEVITAILQAPVDLLFNGGIGTYIKAAGESHLDVGDKSNDSIRVNASAVRASVIVEGGNLGVTPAGRVELALHGRAVNTDALDNSAGVDCSDYEVNIKILLDRLVSAGKVDAAERDDLFRSMTDDVSELVLTHNVSQNALLGTGRGCAADRVLVHDRQIQALAQERGLDLALEALPDSDELGRRRAHGIGLTSPELATLTAHVKLALKADLLAVDLPDNPVLTDRLHGYFPALLADAFGPEIDRHPLRRQIIGTVLTNELIDTAGISYVFRLTEDTGAHATDAVRAYVAASAIFDVPALLAEIARQSPTTAAHDVMVSEVRRLIDRAARWLLTHRPQPLAMGAEISRYRGPMATLVPGVAARLSGADALVVADRGQPLIAMGVDPAQASYIVSLLHAFCGLDIVDIADTEGRDVEEVAELYYALSAYLGIDRLLSAISDLDDTTRWPALARLALRKDVYEVMRMLCIDVMAGAGDTDSAAAKISEWAAFNTVRLARSQALLTEIFDSGELDVCSLSVALQQIRDMIRLRRAGSVKIPDCGPPAMTSRELA